MLKIYFENSIYLRWAFLALSLLGCTAYNANEGVTQKGNDSPEEIVKKYVALSSQGKYEKLKKITVSKTESGFYRRSPEDFGSTSKIGANTKKNRNNGKDREIIEGDRKFEYSAEERKRKSGEEIDKEFSFLWTRSEFPKTILDHKLKIDVIRSKRVGTNMTRVGVQLSNGKYLKNWSWTFLLVKKETGWKIYNIVNLSDIDKF